jgi:TonB family protein
MTWWHYLLLANLYLLLFYGFYALFLRRETFFQLNRIYLIGAAILSFLIPVIQSDWVKHLFITQKVQQTLYSINPMVVYQFGPEKTNSLTIGQIVLTIYVLGIIFLSLRLVWQLALVQYTLREAEPSAAYSFFNELKVGEDVENREVVEAHEQVHMRQWHSADILLTELVMIFNWFNPVVYFYRQAIKHIHEFIADSKAVNAGTSKAEYAMLLLSQSFTAPAHQLVNPFFSQSLLKQRIQMLQKNRSKRVALVKYGLSAPLFALMLVLSSATINDSKVVNKLHDKAIDIFLTQPEQLIENYNLTELAKKTVPQTTKTAMLKRDSSTMHYNPTIGGNKNESNVVFTAVEKVPEFPGGIDAFYRFLGQNVSYPVEMRKNGVEGRVMVQFIVEKDGSLSNIKSVRDKGYGSGEEAVRVMELSPRWHPGIQNGNPVRVQYTVPIVFSLNDKSALIIKDTLTNVTITNSTRPQILAFKYSRPDNDSGKVLSKLIFKSTGEGKPLLIMDGKEINALQLQTMNVHNIKSINVVKDADAAIYGSKADAGVILITTMKSSSIFK